jgi:photosystem II stability/assembly factor-like uncharacterized protein
MKKIFIFFLMGFISLVSMAQERNVLADDQAASSLWTSIGPSGGNILGMAFNPRNKNEIYAVINSYPGQVFRSTNAGSSWTRIALLNEYLYDVTVDPTNSNIIYALGQSCIFKTINRGTTWTQYALPGNCYGWNGQIVISSANPSILFATGCRYYDMADYNKYCMAVFKSTNGGQTWSYKNLAASGCNYGQAYCVAVSKLNNNILYVGGYYYNSSGIQYALYKSVDGGGNYARKTGSISSIPRAIALHPTDPNKAYVGTDWGIYRTSTGGSSWLKNSGTAYAYALAIDGSNPDIIYGGENKRVFKSTNGGINWIEYKTGLYGAGSRLLINSATVYFSSSAGIYKSTNGGVAWASANTGIKSPSVPVLAVAPSSPGTIYVEARANGLFRSTNSGTSWTRLPYFERCDAVLRIAVKSTDAKSLYILAGG